jgi:hypothetical protein
MKASNARSEVLTHGDNEVVIAVDGTAGTSDTILVKESTAVKRCEEAKKIRKTLKPYNPPVTKPVRSPRPEEDEVLEEPEDDEPLEEPEEDEPLEESDDDEELLGDSAGGGGAEELVGA